MVQQTGKVAGAMGAVTDPGAQRQAPPAVPRPAPRRGPLRRLPGWLAVLLAFVLAGALGGAGGAYLATRHSVSDSQLMQLSSLPGRPAPSFTLLDQNHQTRSLASFRRKAVVLYFMDPMCTDVCPLVAQEFVDARRDLGSKASHVVFVGVNVNPAHTAIRWLRQFDAEHGLNRMQGWYYFTGSVPALRTVWKKYDISVQMQKNGNVLHTTVIYFIGPNGRERDVAMPQDYLRPNGTGYLPAGQLSQWGQGIARYASASLH